MRPILICPDDFLAQLLRGTTLPGEPPLFLVRDGAARARIARRGDHAVSGDLEDPAIYRRAFKSGAGPVLLAGPAARLPKMLAALRAAAPHAPVLVLKEDEALISQAGDRVSELRFLLKEIEKKNEVL